MSMNKKLVMAASAALVAGAWAAPVVSVTKTAQDSMTRVVTVEYTLSGEPAVVTLGAETNRGDGVWVSIGDANIQGASGDVNRLVQTGARTVTWRPDRSWPNHRISDGTFRVGVVAWATNAPPDYMAVDLQNSGVVRYYQSADAVPYGVTSAVYKTNQLLLRKIPAAGVEWNMGSVAKESGRGSDETIHRVMLTKDYYIGVYETTRRQYWLMTGNSPSTSPVYPGDEADQCPVETVKWVDLRSSGSVWPGSRHSVGSGSALAHLRDIAGGGLLFDLPTEAQWEYACRAGSGYAFNVGGDSVDDMKNAGWCQENSGQDESSVYYSHAVGGKAPNAWGLYDMHGNVRELCLDYHDGDYYDTDALAEDPEGPSSATYRVQRGGEKRLVYTYCRSAARATQGPNGSDRGTGFRIACEALAK